MSFSLGLECALEKPPEILEGRRFGLLMNQASVDRDFRYAHDLLTEQFPGQLTALFGPQHGMWSEQQDNMVETPSVRDARLELPIHSLYGEHRKPTAEMLEGLELLVVDLQDVGTRVYTFIWTLTYCLEACAAAGIPVLVLDRPNPLGGTKVEGPLLEEEVASLVGRSAIPMRHALTIGELASYLNDAMGVGAQLHVHPMGDWKRTMTWADTGRPWVPTSPNLPRLEGVAVYPGMVLIEGTELSEGRGTTTPFEVVGAPYIDSERLAHRVRAFGDCGVVWRPIRFEPTFQKHSGQSCGGLFIHARSGSEPYSYRAALALLGSVRELWPDEFDWLEPPYEYERTLVPIDILTGSTRGREAVDRGLTSEVLDDLCRVDAEEWNRRTDAHRLYPG